MAVVSFRKTCTIWLTGNFCVSMKQMLVMAKGPDKYFELDRDMPSKPH